MNIPGETAAIIRDSRASHRLLTLACAASLLAPLPSTAAPLWDSNDFIIATHADFVVLDENFNFKAEQCFCGPISGLGLGTLDWLPNGELLLGMSALHTGFGGMRYNRNGVQLAWHGLPNNAVGPGDCKASFVPNEVFIAQTIFGANGGTTSGARRFKLGPNSGHELVRLNAWGGLAVVPRNNGTHELWVAAEQEVGGMWIFPLSAAGEISGPVVNVNVGAASVTMTYDRATHRVLFSDYHDGRIQAMDVETRTVAKVYSIPAGQTGFNIFTGITTGPNGIVIGVESHERFMVWTGNRVGLSIWNADGSGYRFINLDGLPGRDMFSLEDSTYSIPYNILWTGHSPAFTTPATVAGRHVFYNHSAFDGNNAAANAADDDAIAPDKQALLPGQQATFANYTSYAKGVNGVMVDVGGLHLPEQITVADFVFTTGNDGAPAAWPTANPPVSVTVREEAGVSGADRITAVWNAYGSGGPNTAVGQGWLKVRLLANERTGLAQDNVFYFGNAVGESDDTGSLVAAQDALLALNHTTASAAITSPFDFNRDGLVAAQDALLVLNHIWTGFHLLDLGSGAGTSSLSPWNAQAEAELRAEARRLVTEALAVGGAARITDVSRAANGDVNLAWSLPAGRHARLLASEATIGPWQPLPHEPLAGEGCLTLPGRPNAVARFYRLELLPAGAQ